MWTFSRDRSVVYMDAIKPFLVKKDSFDYVFSEHMIEHISFENGEKMLKESFNILKPNGTIRRTPDLRFLLTLDDNEKREIKDRYVNSYNKFYPSASSTINTCMVINNFVRNWGHAFIYDDVTFAQSLKEAGFSNIRKCKGGESEIPAFNNIENHGYEIGHDFNLLKSLVIEADKII